MSGSPIYLIEEVLATYLNGQLSVNVYPMQKEEGDDNCVVYQKISEKPNRTHGKVNSSVKAHFLISCYGTTYDAVKHLVKQIYDLLEENIINFNVSWIDDSRDIPATDTNLFRTDLDLWLIYNDSHLD